MALIKGFVRVPRFELAGPPWCGRDCERCLVEAAGLQADFPPKIPFALQLFRPESRFVMRMHFESLGINLASWRIPLADRMNHLCAHLERGQAVAIWIRLRERSPVAVHSIIVLAYDPSSRRLLVMDNRKRGSANDEHFPVGNDEWSEAKLLALWKGGWLTSNTAAIAYLA